MKRLTFSLILALAFNAFAANNAPQYQFPNYPLRVMKPNWIPHMATRHSEKNKYAQVQFAKGKNEWTANGNYSVQIYPVPPNIRNKKDFYREMRANFKSYIKRDRAKFLPNLTVVQMKKIRVKGHPAYQGIAVDKKSNPAGIYVATTIYMKNAIAVVSLLTPLHSTAEPIRRQIPWAHYKQFMKSLKTVKTS